MSKKPEVFSNKWYAGDFVIPLNKEERIALRLQLEGESRMGRMFMEGAGQRRAVLLDRIEMIKMLDVPASKGKFAIPVQSVFSNEATTQEG